MMYDITFHCFFPDGGVTKHYQKLEISNIPKWIECYQFTHPNCKSISVKVWFSDVEKLE